MYLLEHVQKDKFNFQVHNPLTPTYPRTHPPPPPIRTHTDQNEARQTAVPSHRIQRTQFMVADVTCSRPRGLSGWDNVYISGW